jgi:hypothetical protein
MKRASILRRRACQCYGYKEEIHKKIKSNVVEVWYMKVKEV